MFNYASKCNKITLKFSISHPPTKIRKNSKKTKVEGDIPLESNLRGGGLIPIPFGGNPAWVAIAERNCPGEG
jgi:hypothetical protein